MSSPTRRDLFAAAALQGLVGGAKNLSPEAWASQAWRLADAMVKDDPAVARRRVATERAMLRIEAFVREHGPCASSIIRGTLCSGRIDDPERVRVGTFYRAFERLFSAGRLLETHVLEKRKGRRAGKVATYSVPAVAP